MLNDSTIDNLRPRLAIPGVAQILPGNNGLPKIQIATPAASAEIYLHGAQLTSWHPATSSKEVIFLSQQSHWETGKAIRGGIPICFPWFRAKSDNPKAPSHGVVRTKAWHLESLTEESDGVIVTLATESDEQSRQWWPHAYRIVHRITIGQQLKLELTVTNTGSDPFQFEEALHTYNRVADATKISIIGLDSVSFLDNRDNNREKVQAGDAHFTQQTDNAYLNTQHAVDIVDPLLHRRIRLEKQQSATTVVWNPWQDGAATLADLGDAEWQQMACVEASNILTSAITLPPGEQHTMTATISVLAEGN
jgi:glucose-6-phosphate 1-epimerase